MSRQTPAILMAIMVAFAAVFWHARDPEVVVAGANDTISKQVINIKSFGAIGDGVAMETKAIQDAIDACHAAGGGIVRVPAGDFQTGTIELKSNVALSLDHGANLLGSINKADYRTAGLDDPREGGPHCLIYANETAPTKHGET